MTQRRVPLPANDNTDRRVLKTYVPIETWSDVMDRAEKAGISVSKYLSDLIDRDDLDPDDRSTEPLPAMATA